MKKVGLYLRVSTADQSPAAQRCDLLQLVQQRGWQVVDEYVDTISGIKPRRPGLDRLMNDARHGRLDVVATWSFDRLGRSVRHFLQTVDELQHLNVQFVSFRENVDTTGPTGRIVMIILSAVSRTRTQFDHRKSAQRHAARPIGRPAYRPPPADRRS